MWEFISFYIVYLLSSFIFIVAPILSYFNFCAAVRCDLLTAARVFHYPVFFYVFTFTSEIYISSCFSIYFQCCCFISFHFKVFCFHYTFCKSDLAVTHSLSFCLPGKFFISLSLLKESFAGTVLLVYRLSPSTHQHSESVILLSSSNLQGFCWAVLWTS